MIRTYKYRIYPTAEQERALVRYLDLTRELYNACLEERREAYKRCGKSLSVYDQGRQLKAIRTDWPDIASVPQRLMKGAIMRADRSFQAFFRRVKAGQTPGYPRFKGHKRWDSLCFPDYGHGVKLTMDRLYVKGIGHIKVRLHRPIGGPIKTVTLKRSFDKWYAFCACAVEPQPLPETGTTVGIDVGLTDFLVTDDGHHVPNEKFIYKAQARLRRAQRTLSRRRRNKGKGRQSQRYHKQARRVARQHVTVADTRRDFHHKEARKLVAQHDAIFYENLAIANMVQHPYLARAIHDAGWGQFIAILASKAEEAGRLTIAVNPNGTTQTCVCGEHVPKDLSERWHHCPRCGLSLPRDQVSAMVVNQRGLDEAFRRQRDSLECALPEKFQRGTDHGETICGRVTDILPHPTEPYPQAVMDDGWAITLRADTTWEPDSSEP